MWKIKEYDRKRNRRLLLVAPTDLEVRHLARACREENIETDIITPDAFPDSLGMLQNHDCIVLANVGAVLMIGFGLVLVVLVALVIIIGLSIRITRPLRHMSTSMDRVAGGVADTAVDVALSGTGIRSATLVRMYVPFGSGGANSMGASGRAVTGRACTIANCPSARVHSMSIGIPYSSSISTP